MPTHQPRVAESVKEQHLGRESRHHSAQHTQTTGEQTPQHTVAECLATAAGIVTQALLCRRTDCTEMAM